MSVAILDRIYTPEDLLWMPDGDRYELVNGHLVERGMGALASRVATNLIRRLAAFADDERRGLVFGPDCGYQIFPTKPEQVRYPDGSFVALGRLPGDVIPAGHIKIAPDLALEVVSPNDLAEEIEEKIEDFLTAGVRLLWKLYPSTQRIMVFRANGSVARLGAADELSGEDVVPGFTCRVGVLFGQP